MISWKNLNLNKKLALIAFILGLLAIFLGEPYSGDNVTLNTKELGIMIQRDENKISPLELADMIIQGIDDFTLIDLRSAKEFEEYHINGAINIQPAELLNSGLTRNQKLILYCNNGITSASSTFLLLTKGYAGTRYLIGGLENWKNEVLFPKKPISNEAKDIIEYEKIKAISKYFGGSPELSTDTTTSNQAPNLTMPKISAPKVEKSATTVKPKKKKEGC